MPHTTHWLTNKEKKNTKYALNVAVTKADKHKGSTCGIGETTVDGQELVSPSILW